MACDPAFSLTLLFEGITHEVGLAPLQGAGSMT